MKVRFERVSEADREAVIDLFNYYVENSFSAYPEEKVPYGLFDEILRLTEGYPAYSVRDEESSDRVVGFAFLRPYHPLSSFLRAAEVSCFIDPGCTGRGIGSKILGQLVDEARSKGVDTILANVSSLNEASLRFHEKHGFVECGRFKRVAKKRGRDLDAVWMQKIL
ncbi:MAG TPA: GNAT family N-acetyltransferase [Syntrophales bacterium]|nr:GNAT family N-acetyltransferase [Syntrophales bacterium]